MQSFYEIPFKMYELHVHLHNLIDEIFQVKKAITPSKMIQSNCCNDMHVFTWKQASMQSFKEFPFKMKEKLCIHTS